MEDVVFTPGGMMPAAGSFQALLRCLGSDVRPLLRDFELYSHQHVPKGYSLDSEVEGLRKAADAVRFDTFHLVGYSTCLPMAFVARYPARVRTVALVEPGMIGHGAFAPADMVASHRERTALPPQEQMAAMTRSMLAPGVNPPPTLAPAEPPPPWMQQRLRIGPALVQALLDHDLDSDALHRFNGPVLIAVGSFSHPSLVALARLIAETFPNGQLAIYERRHHMDPVHQAEPEQFAVDLRALWKKADASAASGRAPGHD
jgi:pimeloyl-ACP methyl ester carboxylesterase